jgi:molybdate transport system ATP-binding protein
VSPSPGHGTRTYWLDGGQQTTAVKVKEQISIVSPEMHDRYLQQEWLLSAGQVIESGFGNGDYVYQRLTRDQKRFAAAVAALMGIEELWQRNAQQLSTGELRKVLIARALVSKPKILALDEACDGLDTPSRTDLLRRLDEVGRSGTQILFATHRAEEILPCLTHFVALEGGRIVDQGVLTERRGNDELRRNVIEPKQAPRTRPRAPIAKAQTLLRIRGADVFLERRKVLRNIDWEIQNDQNWAVLGANGAGKTTLLKLAFGDLYAAWGGKVSRFEFTSRDTIWQLRQKVGFVSPELQANHKRPLSGEEIVGSGFVGTVGLHEPLDAKQRRRVSTLLGDFGMSHLARKTALQMSYGELRKILLLRAIVHEPELVIL